MPPTRRRPAAVDPEALAELSDPPRSGGGLRKSPAADPVLTVAGTDRSEPGPARQKRAGGRPTERGATEQDTPKGKVGFYQDRVESARMRAAFDWTRAAEHHASLSDFIAGAVLKEVVRLERKYHDAQPWPDLEPGELPTGRPLSS